MYYLYVLYMNYYKLFFIIMVIYGIVYGLMIYIKYLFMLYA
uniref:Uncharacterized protein n=1 Tax=viral metagenome TaxID=1070528 RepID=A0A6C0JM36_9ZZZZ